jgi:transcriptional regulator with XRE-family HTH domain
MEFNKAECTRIGGTIASIRKQGLGISQSELADVCGLSRSHISRIELGNVAPTLKELNVIASALSTSLTYLLSGIESEQELKWIDDLAEVSSEEWTKIGINARIARVNLGLKQEEVAQKAGDVTRRDICGLENGEFRRAVQCNLPAIAAALNTTPEGLINNEPPKLGEPGSGPAIELLRSERGLTQDQLAALTGISSSTLSRIEKNKRAVEPGELHRIKRAFGIELELTGNYECIPDEEEPTPESSPPEILPPGLLDFALREGLNFEEAHMLSKIHWAGVQPTDVPGWRLLYKAIKIAIAD